MIKDNNNSDNGRVIIANTIDNNNSDSNSNTKSNDKTMTIVESL